MRDAKVIKPGAAWGLVLMAFLDVYREVFETVLFYEALLMEAGNAQTGMVVCGLLVAAVVPAVIVSLGLQVLLFVVIAVVLMRASRRVAAKAQGKISGSFFVSRSGNQFTPSSFSHAGKSGT